MFFGRFYKPWSIQIRVERSGYCHLLSFYRYWTKRDAQDEVDRLSSHYGGDGIHYEPIRASRYQKVSNRAFTA